MFLLLRHAAHDNLGSFLAGRMSGLLLGSAGLAQAERLARRLSGERIGALYTSPRERTRQTAEAVANAAGIEPPRILEALDEIDFGSWSGRSFRELDAEPSWRAWNARRSEARAAGGESYADVQGRIVATMAMLEAEHPNATVGLVSHADVIRAAVMHCLRMAIDDWWRLEVSPASITRLISEGCGVRLLGLNEVVD